VKRALAIWEESLGKDHPNVATALNNLAQLYDATNRPREAESLMKRVVEIFENGLGAGHPNSKVVRGNLEELRGLG